MCQSQATVANTYGNLNASGMGGCSRPSKREDGKDGGAQSFDDGLGHTH
jgi:hypothetical protein